MKDTTFSKIEINNPKQLKLAFLHIFKSNMNDTHFPNQIKYKSNKTLKRYYTKRQSKDTFI